MTDRPAASIAAVPTDDLDPVEVFAGIEDGLALSVLDSSPDCIKLIELNGRLSFMNRNGLCAMEISDFQTVRGKAWPDLWPAETRCRLEQAMADARAGRITRFEAFCPTALGAPRWWHVTVAPVRGGDGVVQRIVAISRDITESVLTREQLEAQSRKLAHEVSLKDAALARQKILLGEIDHRVKNSFAAVIGLLRLQARNQAGNAAAAPLTDAANRIATLARVHEQLHLDPGAEQLDLGDYLSAVATDLCRALNCRLTVDNLLDAPLLANPAQCAAMGQVLAELMGNAVKHGAAHEVQVRLRLERSDTRLVMRVDDNGPGLAEGFDPTRGAGLGMQICQVYTAQMGGTLDHGRSDLGGAFFQATMTPDPAPVRAAQPLHSGGSSAIRGG